MNGRLALIVGGGNVGVGVMLRLLRNAGYEVAMVTHRAAQARQLRSQGPRVQLTGAAHGRLQLDPCPAVAASQRRCVTDLVRAASLVVVAVRPHQLAEVAALLAPGLSRRRRPVNVLVCDNHLDPGNRLAREVARAGGDANAGRHGFVGLLLDQVATASRGDDGWLLHVEANGRLFLDAPALRTDPPVLGGALLVEDHRAYVLRKLFFFSAGHAAAAFLGRLRGHTLMSEALADPWVAEAVLDSLAEARAGLEHLYGSHFCGGPEAALDCLARYADPDLTDTVERVARDPERKLRADDRICGTARLALAAGVDTPALALVAAAGLCAHEGTRARPGVSPAAGIALMSRVSGLAPQHPFARAAGSAYAELSRAGLDLAAGAPAHRTRAGAARDATRELRRGERR
jgi:mannitol-1-phosphate 5-dehydrogenase